MLTFAHEEHTGPQQRFFGHWCHVNAFGACVLQTSADVAVSEMHMAACRILLVHTNLCRASVLHMRL